MKIFTRINSKPFSRFSAMLLLASAAWSFSSCSKDDNTVPAISGLSVVNVSPTLATYNVYLNSAKVSTAALPFTGSINYFQITPGINSVKFTTASSTESVLTKSINLEADKAYSLYLINKADKLDGLLISDDLNAASADKAAIRFINLSPDAGTLTLNQTGGNSLAADQAYKSASAFSSTEAKTYSLEIRDKATGNMLTKLENVKLTAGKIYTIIAAGLVAPSTNDQSLRIIVVTNK
jgi:hypothetical protein